MKMIARIALLILCIAGVRAARAQCSYGVMQFPITCSCPDGSTSYGLPANTAVPGKGRFGYSGLRGYDCGNGCYGVYPAAGTCTASLSPSPELLRLLNNIARKEPVFLADCDGGLQQYAPSPVTGKRLYGETINLPDDHEKMDRIFLPSFGGQ